MNHNVAVKATIEIEKKEPLLEESIRIILNNGACYGTVYSINKAFEIKPINDVAEHMCSTLKLAFPAEAYAKKNGFLFKIKIEINQEGKFITVESVGDVKFFDKDKSIIDLAFYVLFCVELCEDFVIYEMKSV